MAEAVGFDALGDAAHACPAEAAALQGCGLGLSLLTCGRCFLTAADVGVATLVLNPAADPLGETCDAMADPGGYCADLERCIGGSCPEDCGGPVRDLAVCVAEAMCVADISEACYASATAEDVAQEPVGETPEDLLGDALEDVENVMGDVVEDLGNITGGDFGGDALEDLGNFAGDALEHIENVVGDVLGDLGNVTGEDFGGDALEDIGDFAGDALEDIGNVVGDALEDLGNITGEDFSWDVLDNLGNFAGSLVSCSDEVAAFESCDSGPDATDRAACKACQSDAIDAKAIAPSFADIADLPAFRAELCDGMKSGGYCRDLERCISVDCPVACRDLMRAVTTCNVKERLNCDVDCYSAVNKEPAVGAEAESNDWPDIAEDPAASTEADNSGKSFSQISVFVMTAMHVGLIMLSTF